MKLPLRLTIADLIRQDADLQDNRTVRMSRVRQFLSSCKFVPNRESIASLHNTLTCP